MLPKVLEDMGIPIALQHEDHTETIGKIRSSDSSFSSGTSSFSDSLSIVDEAEMVAIEEGQDFGWEKPEDSDSLPDKVHGRHIRNLLHQILNIYRRLFSFVFVTNMGFFIATIMKRSFDLPHLGLIAIANIFVAILMRQEYVVNAFFFVFCSVPPSWPLFIRRLCARVYSIGGIAYCILALLLVILVFALPNLRLIAHDRFERTHRFLGWTAVALVWCLIVLLTDDYRKPTHKLGTALLKSPPFWLVVVLTLSIILPWARLRKYPVRAEVLSEHAVRLHFDYGITPIAGSFTRISDSPLLEWHSFATMTEPSKEGSYSIIISRAGDWTSKQIEEPPSTLWVRGIPTCGVLRIVPMFRRVVLVATGSGIAPIAPHIFAQRVPIRLLWVSPNIRKTFSDKLVDDVLKASPDAVVHGDYSLLRILYTREHGRPDMVKLSYRLYREFEAEAVCIISNQSLTQKVIYGLSSRGIPAFGAIWDS
ncbi:hypothetical protein EW145_g1404 [Phellinidium pouzarii]|uniref:FAD-binding FR-type domain-containing protein n=1 Tax=Phellinidium pouzarii TaxID=167371 RepID=A0A4S4LEL6_9AGAM|nr:hypothetical protein EW145_g1404 [Phellinidium pouzarii]